MAPALAPHPVGIAPPPIARWEPSATGVRYVHERDSGVAGPEVLVTALVHGNEFSGAIVLGEWLSLDIRPRTGRITVAFCNVDAFARFDAASPDDSRCVDEDFNRVWSAAKLHGAGDTTELRRAREIRPFVDRCTHLLDLHSMHEPCEPLLVTGVLPRDIRFARQLGCGGRVMIDEGHADGVRMRDWRSPAYPSDARIALLLEAGQHWDPASLVTARNVFARFLVAAGALETRDLPEGWWQVDAAAPAAIEVTHRVVARSDAFRFLGDYTGGEVIARAGTPIAVDAHEPVVTPYDDCVLVMPSLRQLRPGVTTVRLGRFVAT